MKKYVLFLAVLLLAAGCGSENPENSLKESSQNVKTSMAEKPSSVAKAEESQSAPAKETPEEDFRYLSYSEEIFQKHLGTKPLALFFHADWCPTCRVLEKNIQKDLSSLPKNSAIIKANFDTESEIKRKYGVSNQSTLVFFDKNGNQTEKLLNPGLGKIRELLQN